MLIEVYNSLPTYTYWLIWWALPSTISFLTARHIYKNSLSSRFESTREMARRATYTLGIFWPILAFVIVVEVILLIAFKLLDFIWWLYGRR